MTAAKPDKPKIVSIRICKTESAFKERMGLLISKDSTIGKYIQNKEYEKVCIFFHLCFLAGQLSKNGRIFGYYSRNGNNAYSPEELTCEAGYYSLSTAISAFEDFQADNLIKKEEDTYRIIGLNDIIHIESLDAVRKRDQRNIKFKIHHNGWKYSWYHLYENMFSKGSPLLFLLSHKRFDMVIIFILLCLLPLDTDGWIVGTKAAYASEDELTENFSWANSMTVKKALKEFITMGLIEKKEESSTCSLRIIGYGRSADSRTLRAIQKKHERNQQTLKDSKHIRKDVDITNDVEPFENLPRDELDKQCFSVLSALNSRSFKEDQADYVRREKQKMDENQPDDLKKLMTHPRVLVKDSM